jgi:hypothetical protein
MARRRGKCNAPRYAHKTLISAEQMPLTTLEETIFAQLVMCYEATIASQALLQHLEVKSKVHEEPVYMLTLRFDSEGPGFAWDSVYQDNDELRSELECGLWADVFEPIARAAGAMIPLRILNLLPFPSGPPGDTTIRFRQPLMRVAYVCVPRPDWLPSAIYNGSWSQYPLGIRLEVPS